MSIVVARWRRFTHAARWKGRAPQATTGVALRSQLLVGNLTIIPAHTNFSAFSPTYLAVFMVAACSIPVAIYLAGRPRGTRAIVPVWDGGIVAFKPRMQYSSMTFSAPMRVTFSGLYQQRVRVQRASDEPAGRSGPVHYESAVPQLFHRFLYRPIVATVEWIADFIRPVQSGDVNLYLLYVFIAVLAAYFIAAL